MTQPFRRTRRALGAFGALVFVVAALVACRATGPSSAPGTGPDQTATVAIGDYVRVRVSNGIHLEIRRGPTEAVTLRGPASALEHVVVEVAGGELSLAADHTGTGVERISAVVSTETLEGIAVDTGARASATDLDAERLAITASESASVALAGVTDAIEIAARESAAIEALGLEVDTARIDLGTSATASVRVASRIEGAVHESAVLRVAGAPVVMVTTRTGGRIEPIAG